MDEELKLLKKERILNKNSMEVNRRMGNHSIESIKKDKELKIKIRLKRIAMGRKKLEENTE